jgi:hypothetical protein
VFVVPSILDVERRNQASWVVRRYATGGRVFLSICYGGGGELLGGSGVALRREARRIGAISTRSR